MSFNVPFRFPFPRVHEACGVKTQMVVTRLASEGNWEGYCPSCLGIVFGTLYLVPDSSGQMELGTAL
jgi:hypothetical protein